MQCSTMGPATTQHGTSIIHSLNFSSNNLKRYLNCFPITPYVEYLIKSNKLAAAAGSRLSARVISYTYATMLSEYYVGFRHVPLTDYWPAGPLFAPPFSLHPISALSNAPRIVGGAVFRYLLKNAIPESNAGCNLADSHLPALWDADR